VLRATMPAEFQDHWHAWQREMLLAARSLLDHYIEHVERERHKSVQVEDIPIE
jgi:ferric-dicitrate binding protein FerR (iron transport regulator)